MNDSEIEVDQNIEQSIYWEESELRSSQFQDKSQSESENIELKIDFFDKQNRIDQTS